MKRLLVTTTLLAAVACGSDVAMEILDPVPDADAQDCTVCPMPEPQESTFTDYDCEPGSWTTHNSTRGDQDQFTTTQTKIVYFRQVDVGTDPSKVWLHYTRPAVPGACPDTTSHNHICEGFFPEAFDYSLQPTVYVDGLLFVSCGNKTETTSTDPDYEGYQDDTLNFTSFTIEIKP